MIFRIEPASETGSNATEEGIFIEAEDESKLSDAIVGSMRTWICQHIDVMTVAEAKAFIQWDENRDPNEVPF